MGTWLEPLNGKNKLTLDAKKNENNKGKAKSVTISNMSKILHSNQIFERDKLDYYNKFFRFGHIDPYNTDQISREYLFFTKPDLYILEGTNLTDAVLNDNLKDHPFFKDAFLRHKNALGQLQSSIKDSNGKFVPFMRLLTNTVTSKMDLPAISAESQDSTNNIYGVNINYRSHSLKSDNGFDFSLSFTDTMYLEIYTMVKAYDEYMRLNKMGQISCYGGNFDNLSIAKKHKNYIINKIIPEQFSIYKFLVGSDGETIRYYAKATGVYFTDVPRSDFGDPPADGFKYSLTFHANFIEDMNPMIIQEFNTVTRASGSVMNVTEEYGINNELAKYPVIDVCKDNRAGKVGIDYRLKWTK